MKRKKEAAGCGCGSIVAFLILVGVVVEFWKNYGTWGRVGAVALAVVIMLFIIASIAQLFMPEPKCAVCGSPIGDGKAHGFLIDGQESEVCTGCARHLRSKISKAAVKAKFGE